MKSYIFAITSIVLLYSSFGMSKEGMPQFDIETFSSQIFWLLICFVLFYYIMSKVILPKINQSLSSRRDKIMHDIDSAQTYKEETEKIIEEYQNTLKDRHDKRNDIIKSALRKAEIDYNNKISEVNKNINKRFQEAEQRIKKSKTKVLDNINKEVLSLSNKLVSKTLGVKIDPFLNKESNDSTFGKEN